MMNTPMAERMNHIAGSVIRKFAEKAATDPTLITFANGNPSAVTFPVEDMKRFYDEALTTGYSESLMQYGTVQGYMPLVNFLKDRLAKKYGFDWEENDLFIVSGGTQAVDVASKIWLDKDGRVFYTSSLSKVIAPSFRLGYLVVNKRFGQNINICKQCMDVHSNTLGQYVAWGIMTKTDYDAHIKLAQEEYRRKSTLISETLKKTIHPSCKISNPTGGMFIMMFMPDSIDAEEFVWKGIDRGVVCVPGSGFAIDGEKPSHSVRMCYSTAADDQIVKGAEIIGKLTWDMIEGKA